MPWRIAAAIEAQEGYTKYQNSWSNIFCTFTHHEWIFFISCCYTYFLDSNSRNWILNFKGESRRCTRSPVVRPFPYFFSQSGGIRPINRSIYTHNRIQSMLYIQLLIHLFFRLYPSPDRFSLASKGNYFNSKFFLSFFFRESRIWLLLRAVGERGKYSQGITSYIRSNSCCCREKLGRIVAKLFLRPSKWSMGHKKCLHRKLPR